MVVQDRYPRYEADQRRFFDEKIVEDWDRYDSREWDAVRRFEVARLMGTIRPRRILDVGCGCGFHDAEMARYDFVERVDGIDYSANSIEKAEKHYPHGKVNRRVLAVEDVAQAESYDLVVSFQVIEHPPDAGAFLAACARCCAAGGHVAAFTVNRLRPYNRRRLQAGREIEFEDPMHKEEFVAADLRALGNRAGLEAVRVFHYHADRPGWPVSLRLWAGLLAPWTATRLAAVWKKPKGREGA